MAAESKKTTERLCETAESLFGKLGFANVSLRKITEAAGANLAAVNYHFGSKEELYKEVLLRRLRPLNEERLAMLAQAEQLAGDQPIPLRSVLEAFIRPLLRRAADPALGGIPLLRLISRDLTDPRPFMHDELAREFGPVVSRFTEVLSQIQPRLPPADLFWRLQFTIGALVYVAAKQHDLVVPGHGTGQTVDDTAISRRLIDFCTAGFAAATSIP